jgi:hypothetical protein
VLVAIEEQSPDIAQGLHYEEALEKLGAGDQGIMFGYATDETPELFPLTLQLSHKLNKAMKDARNDGSLPWLRPDTKTQVTIEYKHDGGAVIPLRVDTVVVSAQHSEDISTDDLRKEVRAQSLLLAFTYPIKIGMLTDTRSKRRSSRRSSLSDTSTTRPSTTSNPLAASSLVDLRVMLVSLAARSSLTPTVAGVLTAVELSPERITPRLTVRPPTSPAGSPSRSWLVA